MSTYDTALAASRAYVDTRTPAQRRWDERAYQVGEYIARMRTMTQIDRVSWSRTAAGRDAMEEYLKDALREVRALQVEGFRPGDAAPPLASPAMIDTPVAGQAIETQKVA